MMVSHVGRDLPGWERGIRSATSVLTARNQVAKMIHSHCSSAGVLSDRMGFGPPSRRGAGVHIRALGRQGDAERSSRRGYSAEIHIVHLADVVEVHLRNGGLPAAVGVVGSRRGTQFSPAVADVFERDAAGIVDGLLEMDVWTAALAQAPRS